MPHLGNRKRFRDNEQEDDEYISVNSCDMKRQKKGCHPPEEEPMREGRWTEGEKLLFLIGLRKYGRGKWKEIGTILTTR